MDNLLKLLTILFIFLFLGSCSEPEPEPEPVQSNLYIEFDSSITQTSIENITSMTLFVFNAFSQIETERMYYDSLEKLEQAVVSISTGADSYTIMAVSNLIENYAPENLSSNLTISALVNDLNIKAGTSNNHLVAKTYVEVGTSTPDIRLVFKNNVAAAVDISTLTVNIITTSQELQTRSLATTRYITEVYNNVSSCLLIRNVSTSPVSFFYLPSDSTYTILAWCDTSEDDTYYDTSSLEKVTINTSAYPSSILGRDAVCGSENITPSQDTSININCDYPYAKLVIESNDVMEYLDSESNPALSDLKVEVTYTSSTPTEFNVSKSLAYGTNSGHSFSTMLTDVDDETIVLAEDLLLANDQTSTTISINIIDTNTNKSIAMLKDKEISYSRGYITTYSDAILTNKTATDTGLDVDTEWSGLFEENF